MPKATNKGKRPKGHTKETQNQICDGNLNVKHTRSRSRSEMKSPRVMDMKSPKRPKTKQRKIDQGDLNDQGVKRRIIFDEIAEVGLGSGHVRSRVGENNNAPIDCQKSKKSLQESIPQNNFVGDGYLCEVEEELDYEYDEQLDNNNIVEASGSSDNDEIEGGSRSIGGTEATEMDEQTLLQNPGLRKLFNQLLDERIEQVKKNGESSGSTILSTFSPQNQNKDKTPGLVKDRIKSPSDTTIYVPALKRNSIAVNGNNSPLIENVINSGLAVNNSGDKISDFVEAIRMEQELEDIGRRKTSKIVVPGQEQARECTERTIIEAEKYKAAIETPPGMLNHFNPLDHASLEGPVVAILQQGGVNTSVGLSDDDFFHLICHVDSNLKEKIERGDYVDLDKLLVKDNNGPWSNEQFSDCERLEWVRNEMGTFLMPAKKQNKINNFRRWEQAFHIYATIYCGKNPHRAHEIWQYISVINTASNSFI